MEASFWQSRWETNQIGFHETQVHAMLLAHGARLGTGGRVFVPLCGKSRDMHWLRAQGHDVLGIELADIAVRAFFAEHGMTPVHTKVTPFEHFTTDGYLLLCGDYFALTREIAGPFTAIYDRAALIALPPQMRRAYAAHMTALAETDTCMLLITVDYDPSVISPPPFAVSADEVQTLYGDAWAIENRGTRAADVKGQAGSEQAFVLRRL